MLQNPECGKDSGYVNIINFATESFAWKSDFETFEGAILYLHLS